MLSRAAIWIAALWWGSLSTVGFYVVPLLFAHLPSPALAGNMAAKLFSAQTWAALGCGLVLLLIDRSNQDPAQSQQARKAIVFVMAGMLFALVSELVIAPHIVERDNLRLWHSLGVLFYALQWVSSGLVFRALLAQRSG